MISVWIEMTLDPDFAVAASLLAEPARAAILARLLDGRSWTATELAKAAAISPSTGSSHLAKLLEQGWVVVHPQGRHRYYRLAGEGIASFLESFACISPDPKARTPGELRASATLRDCRLCYDHLAGRLGVAFTQNLQTRRWLDLSFQLTEAGREGLSAQGLEMPAESGRGCMDWSERRLHLAGPLGRALANALLEAGWLQRDPKSRALWVTPSGHDSLEQLLGREVIESRWRLSDVPPRTPGQGGPSVDRPPEGPSSHSRHKRED
jgi:DNA-binding transcriptional ArsR family regulator